MIVKNEVHGIARTLQSAKPFVDRWCILDTGSTDGTPEIIRAEMAGVPGDVLSAPFVDFATTRNLMLDGAKKLGANPPEFLLLLDADDILEGGEALRAWLGAWHEEAERLPLRRITIPEGAKMIERDGSLVVPPEECQIEIVPPEEAFMVSMSEGSTVWSSARVVRASAVGPAGWHYEGVVHEALVHPSGRQPTITIPGVSIRHDPPPQSIEARRARWERDVEALRAVVTKDPKDGRALFYLARTLRQLERREEAQRAFSDRIALGGWREEVFEALMESARLFLYPEDQVTALLSAHAHSPHRAEPLVALAEYFRFFDQHGPAFTFAHRATELVYPATGLFVDRECYTWRAEALAGISGWYVGEYWRGEEACRRALAAGPPPDWRAALERNLQMYVERREAEEKAALEAKHSPEERARGEAAYEGFMKRVDGEVPDLSLGTFEGKPM